MKQIQTVTAPIERSEWFDDAVNKFMSKGWVLTKRDIVNVSGTLSEAFNAPVVQMLYAELERHTPTFDEVTL